MHNIDIRFVTESKIDTFSRRVRALSSLEMLQAGVVKRLKLFRACYRVTQNPGGQQCLTPSLP